MAAKWKTLKVDEQEINNWVDASILALTHNNSSLNHWARTLLNNAADAQFRKTKKILVGMGLNSGSSFEIVPLKPNELSVLPSGSDKPVAGPFVGPDRQVKAQLATEAIIELLK